MGNVHSAAQKGFSNEAEAYGRGRPDYPSALREWLERAMGLSPGKRVVDVGAGTGKFTALLAATGAAVVAVEPVDAMREKLQRLHGVEALAGTAQSIPLPDASLDAVVCAQAFHWFASTAALDEFARVLKPGGTLGLVWNVRDESVDWVAKITQLITPYEGDAPRFYKGDWKKPFPHAKFSALREASFEYQHVGPAQQVIIDRFMSVSFIASLAQDDKDHVRDALVQLIEAHPALKGRDTIAFPYRTLAYDCMRLA